MYGGTPESVALFRGQLLIMRMKGSQTILGGCCNGTSLEIHLEAVIERVWRCTWRPRSREFGDANGGRG